MISSSPYLGLNKLGGPNYFHCAPKTGSTTLYYILNKHRDVCAARGKEPNFFSNDDYYEKGEDLFWSEHFAHYRGERVAADFSTAYVADAKAEKCLSRIFRKRSPSTTFFSTCIRHPLMWHWSHYLHRVRNIDGFRKLAPMKKSFEEYLEDASKGRGLTTHLQQLKRLKEIYSGKANERNLLILIYEHSVEEDISIAYSKICDFLSVDPSNFEMIDGIRSNERTESTEKISTWSGTGTFSNLKTNRAYLPAIYQAVTSGVCQSGEEFSRGDIIIERDKTHVTIIDNPVYEDAKALLEYYSRVSTSLSLDQMEDFSERYFGTVTDRTEEILEREIPEWRRKMNSATRIEEVTPSYL